MVVFESLRSGGTVAGSFGTIPYSHTVHRFSLGNHWRLMAVLAALSVAPACLLIKGMDGKPVSVPARPATVVLAKRGRQMARKQPRLRVPVALQKTAKLEMIEDRMDGSVTSNTYFSASIDLSDDAAPKVGDKASDKAGNMISGMTSEMPGLAAGYGNAAPIRPDPFTLILGSKDQPPARPGQKSTGARGVPINVSIAAESPAPAVKRLVAMPRKQQNLNDIEGTLSISDADWDALGHQLGTDHLQAGERLEIIYTDGNGGEAGSHILLARYVDKAGQERLIARQSNGQCQEIRNRALYDRLVAEALARHDDEAVIEDDAEPVKAAALARAKADYPQVMARMKQQGVPQAVALQVVDLLKINDLHVSDDNGSLSSLHVVFRKTESGAVELVFLSVDDHGEEKRFYRYRDHDGHKAEFLDESGRSASKPLLSNPVPGGRSNDGFGWRMHPILHRPEFHNGVDYDAPMGAPILAAGDGVVIKISSEPGYGKYVRVKHDFSYTTTYAHISGTAKGLKVGDRVTQGQVIAYIGSTGLSTGPHLYYELRMGDKYADPTKTRVAAGTVLQGDALSAFHKDMERVNDIARSVVDEAKSVATAVGDGIGNVVVRPANGG
ncbi:M23 family metallopeptidase [Rhizobium paknamense]|uniref:M23ase beta-sheet core domain-containing protein n=1 Tax=Rhizobium paknamense TaxID=1206817 RepID=A0ABU0I885_9HYPH|nr:M23 family metallopeptidase [Rhizobium paknamense]MDQ0454442.1 hypothetical protein [Rhizobium paknamense]